MDPTNTPSSSSNPYFTETNPATNSPGESSNNLSGGSKADDMKERVQRNVKKVAGQARDQTVKTVETKKHAVADQVDGIAKALHKAADQLGEQQQGNLAHYAHNFADKLDNMVGTLHNKDINTLLRQTRDMARRQPGLFVGGAMIAGFLLIRFLTSPNNDNRRGRERSSYSPSRSGVYPAYQEKDGFHE